MPALAALPPTPLVFQDYRMADTFGEEGYLVSKAAVAAVRHWEDRAEWILMHSSESDELDYETVPLADAGVVRVRYKLSGRIEPMRYEWDD